jgi:hypothetical protein
MASPAKVAPAKSAPGRPPAKGGPGRPTPHKGPAGKGKPPEAPAAPAAPPPPDPKIARLRRIMIGMVAVAFVATLGTGGWILFVREPEPIYVDIPPPEPAPPRPTGPVVRQGDLTDDLWKRMGVRPQGE